MAAEMTLEEAADRLAIRELVDAYAHYADRRNCEGQMALFTQDTRFLVFMTFARRDGPLRATVLCPLKWVVASYCRRFSNTGLKSARRVIVWLGVEAFSFQRRSRPKCSGRVGLPSSARSLALRWQAIYITFSDHVARNSPQLIFCPYDEVVVDPFARGAFHPCGRGSGRSVFSRFAIAGLRRRCGRHTTWQDA